MMKVTSQISTWLWHPLRAKSFIIALYNSCETITHPRKLKVSLNDVSSGANLCTLDGEFGAMMEVNLVNDGPVTLQLDSRKFVYVEEKEQSPTSTTPSPKPKKQD